MTTAGSYQNNFSTSFFPKLSEDVTAAANSLMSEGCTVVVQYQAIQVKYPWGGNSAIFALPYNSTAIIKGTIPPQGKFELCEKLLGFFKKIKHQIAEYNQSGVASPPLLGGMAVTAEVESPPPPPPKEISFTSSGQMKVKPEPVSAIDIEKAEKAMTETELKDWLDEWPWQKIKKGMVTEEKVKPVTPGVIALKDATEIGQLVHGTSEGSVYKVIAIGERIRMAARIKGTHVSIRVEGPINTAERNALVQMGFGDNGAYLSWHVNPGAVPIERVIACTLFHSDFKFTKKVNHPGEVPGGTS